MQIISDKDLSDFFADFPLYSKIKFFDTLDTDQQLNLYEYLSSRAYKFYCPHDKDFHTFKFNKKWGEQFIFYEQEIPETLTDKNGNLNFSFYISSTCQICGYRMDMLLNVFTISPKKESTKYPSVYLRKIGQLPAVERQPNLEVANYLSEEDRELYNKALSNLSVSFGIGAYSYFRRIVENEIKRLVKDISELEYDNVDKVRKAWEEYQTNHQMTTLIEAISPFLPKSLKEIGDNPLKVLYQQTSGGIHEFSDEVCLEKARHIDKLLQYVIKRISSMKLEFLEAREAMRNLTSN